MNALKYFFWQPIILHGGPPRMGDDTMGDAASMSQQVLNATMAHAYNKVLTC